MGFNNEGVDAAARRLNKWKTVRTDSKLIIGGNIGKNKVTDNELAWKDYEICFNTLFDSVDYFVVNVSSPNTPGLRALQEKMRCLRFLAIFNRLIKARRTPNHCCLKLRLILPKNSLTIS